MIKSIYLHAGVPKTASTSIQNLLGEHREILNENGYLYPQFKICGKRMFNHGIPFCSLLAEDPAKYHVNIRNGLTDDSVIEKRHDEYKKEISEQIAGFKGENLILSGEDFSLMNRDQLMEMKEYLVNLTNSEVLIYVVLFCRHPLSRTRSIIQQHIKGGKLTLEMFATGYKKNYKLNYKTIISNFSGIVPKKNICVIRFEDAIQNQFGPAAELLSVAGAKPALIRIFENKVYNTSLSYEAIILLNAINNIAPVIIGNKKNPDRIGLRHDKIMTIPGSKFCLPVELNRKIWEFFYEDINWLCSTFSLPEYVYEEECVPDVEKVWGPEVFESIKKALHWQSGKFRSIILEAIREEIENPGLNLSDSKKVKMRRFIYDNRSVIVILKYKFIFILTRITAFFKKFYKVTLRYVK